MKVDPNLLFRTSGIRCLRVTHDAQAKTYDSHDAIAAFVTEDTIAAVRAKRRAGSARATGSLPDVRYGDVLVSWRDKDGRAQGLRAAAGMDAGLQVALRRDGKLTQVPFTGRAMLGARERLLEQDGKAGLNLDQGRVLSGIQGVIDVILADPDPDRFPAHLIGQVFASMMIDRIGKVDLPVTDEEFGRKARSDLLRARIGLIDPEHRDALGSAGTLRSIIDGALSRSAFTGGPLRSASGATIDEAAMRRMILSSDRMTREVFGSMTTRDIPRMSAAPVTIEVFDELCEKLSEKRLTGQWVDRAQNRIREITGELTPGYDCRISLFSVSGVDILAVRDSVGDAMGAAYIYSWPTSERLPVASFNSERTVNLSPEEIPDEIELERLDKVYRVLAHGPVTDPGLDVLGAVGREEDLA